MSNPLSVLRVFALVSLIFGACMLVPFASAWYYSDGSQYAYDEAMVITAIFSGGLWLFTRKYTAELKARDGFLLVALTWLGLPVFASIPLLVYFKDLSFTDAYFETVSALTTSGGTIFTGLDAFPFSINLWRAELQWIGGMGLIVLAVAILPLLGVGGRQVFNAEASGPMKESKLTPRMAQTAKGLWLIYTGLSAACVLGYWLAGMSWGDALIHMFATMSLGGFSNHDASFGYWNSPAIEGVAIVFMTLSAMNFSTHFLAWREKKLTPYGVDPEVGWCVLVLYVSIVGLAGYLWHKGAYADFWTALRYTAFNTVSVATTTGFANTDYAQWPFFAPLWMLFLSSFISCAGSTGGGIKMLRAIVLYKHVWRELLRAMHPAIVNPLKLGKGTLANNVVFAVLAFGFVYMVSIVSMTLVLSFTGLDIVSAFSAVVASINCLGPGLGDVGPASNFGSLTGIQKWVCIFAMLLGRLEIFTLLVVLTPAFWRK